MILYHGTNIDFPEIDLAKSKVGKDFGVGFQIRRLEDGIISMSQFLEEIKYHKVTMQYFFASPQSLNTLKRL